MLYSYIIRYTPSVGEPRIEEEYSGCVHAFALSWKRDD